MWHIGNRTRRGPKASVWCRLVVFGSLWRASKGLADALHRLLPFSYPKVPKDNLYGSLSTTLGINYQQPLALQSTWKVSFGQEPSLSS